MEDSIEDITPVSHGDSDIEIVAIHPAVRKEEVVSDHIFLFFSLVRTYLFMALFKLVRKLS